jgi:Ca-activated chloride channel family protein
VIDFGDQAKLWALTLVPVVVLLWRLGEARRERRLASALGLAPGARVASGVVGIWRSWLRTHLVAFAVACLVVAWAKPRIGYEWVALKRAGTDVVVAVDVSRSMLAGDVHPTRLERARREVQDLLELTRGDRIGLVAFAGKAFIQCPLTEDTSALRLFMSYLDAELIPVQGTNLGAAVKAALEALDAGGQGGDDVDRSILLVTDGENLTDKGQAQAAVDLAKSRGIKIHTLAVGTPGGAPVPEEGGGLKKDKSGNVVLTRPDEAALKAMAAATGGVFQRSVAGDGDMRRIYDEGIRAGAAVREQAGDAKERRWHDRYRWFVGLALLALFLEFVWAHLERVARDRAQALAAASAALCLLLLGGAIAPDTSLGAEKAGAESAPATIEELDVAEKEYMDREIENPDEPRHAFNRGVIAYKRRKFSEAAEAFARAAKASDPALAERSLFNLGNAHAENGAFDEAVEAYGKALELAPDDDQAKENLAYVQKLKSQQEQQEQQQQKQDQQQQKQDQQKQDEQQKQDQQSQTGHQQQSGTDQQQAQQAGGTDQQQTEAQSSGGETSTSTSASTSSGDSQSAEEKGAADAPEAKQDDQAGTGTDTGVAEADGSQEKGKDEAFKRAKRGKAVTPTDADRTLEAVQDQISKYIFGNARREPSETDGRDW